MPPCWQTNDLPRILAAESRHVTIVLTTSFRPIDHVPIDHVSLSIAMQHASIKRLDLVLLAEE